MPWDVVKHHVTQLWPTAEFYRYSCKECFRELWSPLLGSMSARTCGHGSPSANQPSSLPASTETSTNTAIQPSAASTTSAIKLAFVAYDGAPDEYVRPPQFPSIHLDLLFCPASAWAFMLHKCPGKNERLILLDPNHRANAEAERAVGRLLGGHFVHVESASIPRAAVEAPPSNPVLAKAAIDLLREEAVRPGQRHTVANLLGAMILQDGLRAPQGFSLVTDLHDVRPALQSVLKALGLVPTLGQQATSDHWFECSRWHKWIDTFLVLDDMYNYGWGTFLFRALQIDQLVDVPAGLRQNGIVLSGFQRNKKYPTIRFTDNPSTGFGEDGTASILDVLRESSHRLKGEPLHFCNPSGREALFLDLRLFMGRGLEEFNFYGELLELVDAAEALRYKLFPDQQQFATIRDWVQLAKQTRKWKEDDELYYQCLTLLPRIIADTDPTLPIVLFSSTGQRKVLELLRAFPNIIVEFDKPRFFGVMPEQIVDAGGQRFVAAMDRCVHLARGRAAICALFDEKADGKWLTLRLSKKLDDAMKAQRESEKIGGNFALAEIYLDETGNVDIDREFGVGGIALLYKDPSHAELLDRELKNRGLTWGLADGYPPATLGDSVPRVGRYLAKMAREADLPCLNGYTSDPNDPNNILDEISKQNTYNGYYREAFKEVANALQSWDIRILVFGFLQDIRTLTVHRQTLMDPKSLDFCYRSMLVEAAETIVFDVLLPIYEGRNKLEVRIDAAARVYDNPAAQTKIDDWWKQFAIARRGRGRFLSLSPDHLHALFTEILIRRQNAADRLVVTRARAVHLTDYATLANDAQDFREYKIQQKDSPRPKQVHYLADWVLRLLRQDNPVLKPFLQACGDSLRQERNEWFNFWLLAGRAASCNDRVTAVANACRAWFNEQHQDEALQRRLARWVLPQARIWASALGNEGLNRVCDLLRGL